MTRRLVLIGVGPGDPEQLTLQAVTALQSLSTVVVTEKGTDDPLADARRALTARHCPDVRVVAVRDPERERSPARTGTLADYRDAVTNWHAARADRYSSAIATLTGDIGFLVWGDPALYDSTIRVLGRVAESDGSELVVLPGISSVQALAAAHRIVLHEIGQSLHITTGRLLPEALDAGQRNIAVMLNRDLSSLSSLGPQWTIWWGANLGTPSQSLVSGRVPDVLARLHREREAVKATAGWVMDVHLLRR